MPRPRKREMVQGQYFTWKVYVREGTYWADGRTNRPPTGRFSLGTKSYNEAIETLKKLDLVQAIELGLADKAALQSVAHDELILREGVRLYQLHTQRPDVAHGASAKTWQRYKAVFDKWLPFLEKRGIRTWNRIRKQHLLDYAAYLKEQDYAYRTYFLELTTIKQAINWLIKEGRLPAESQIDLELGKPQGTDVYCWTTDQVGALIEHCRVTPGLDWLRAILTGLACSGMRISELANLRWSDIDLAGQLITLKDETSTAPCKRRNKKRGKIVEARTPRRLKGRRNRCFPIHKDLQAILETMERADDGYVFHGPLGGRVSADIVRRTLIRDVLVPLANRFPTPEDEIGFADGRLHSFRHFFCSRCSNENVPEQLLMSWLGHRESGLIRHYYHAFNAESQRQMQRIDFLGSAGASGAAAE